MASGGRDDGGDSAGGMEAKEGKRGKEGRTGDWESKGEGKGRKRGWSCGLGACFGGRE